MNLNEKSVFRKCPYGRGVNRYKASFKTQNRRVNKVQLLQTGSARKLPNTRSASRTTLGSSNINWTCMNRSKSKSILHTTTSSESKGNTSESVDSHSYVILALAEGRGNACCEVGMAVINITIPSVTLCQMSDLQRYVNTLTKLNVFNPTEILIPMTFVNGHRLTGIIQRNYPNAKITAVPRMWYHNANGFRNLSDICAPFWKSTLLIVKQKFYAVTAFNALFMYLQSLNINYSKDSLKIEFQVSTGHAIIDVATADNLELVACRRNVYDKQTSLMGILNHCKTKIGTRLLRANILQPPCIVAEIESRLDCVQELLDSPGMLTTLQECLLKLSSIHQLLSLSSLVPRTQPHTPPPPTATHRHINYLIVLSHLLQQAAPLAECLEEARHDLLVTVRHLLQLPVVRQLRDIVGEIVVDDIVRGGGLRSALGAQDRAFVIKAGVNPVLDVVRTSYSKRIDEMSEYVRSLSNKHGLNLTLVNTIKKGYHMTMQINKSEINEWRKSSLPEDFIQVDRRLGSVTMKTPHLMNLGEITENILEEIIKLSNSMICTTLIEIRKHMDLFYLICENIAKIDMIQSLAEASTVGQAVRPIFKSYTKVVASKHPLLCFLRPQEPIPNDINCSSYHNLHIITGANGSGKSIYIRQIILLQVMAQVGCFVPATKATFRVSDRIFARVTLMDDLENGASSFILELREIDYFLSVMSDNTLLVIDELGRSTSLESGTAMAFAICEKLLQTKAFIFITTHFTLLAKIQHMYLNVMNWQLETIETERFITENCRQLDFTYALKPGVISLKRYGVYFARCCWPVESITDVDNMLKNVQEKELPDVDRIDSKIRLKYDLEAELELLEAKTEANITTLLKKYEKDLSYLINNPSANKVPIVINNCTIDDVLVDLLRPDVVYSDSNQTSTLIQDESTNYGLQEQENINESPSTRFISRTTDNQSNGPWIASNILCFLQNKSTNYNNVKQAHGINQSSSDLLDNTISSHFMSKTNHNQPNRLESSNKTSSLSQEERNFERSSSGLKEITKSSITSHFMTTILNPPSHQSYSNTTLTYSATHIRDEITNCDLDDQEFNEKSHADSVENTTNLHTLTRIMSDDNISLDLFRKDQMDREKFENMSRLQHSHDTSSRSINPFNFSSDSVRNELVNFVKPIVTNTPLLRQKTFLKKNVVNISELFSEQDLESIRSEVESCNDELLEEWKELQDCSQNSLNDFISDDLRMQMLQDIDRPISGIFLDEVEKGPEDQLSYVSQSQIILNDFISDDLPKQLLEDNEQSGRFISGIAIDAVCEQTSKEFELESIRSELESCGDEFFKEWDRPEDENSYVPQSQIRQNDCIEPQEQLLGNCDTNIKNCEPYNCPQFNLEERINQNTGDYLQLDTEQRKNSSIIQNIREVSNTLHNLETSYQFNSHIESQHGIYSQPTEINLLNVNGQILEQHQNNYVDLSLDSFQSEKFQNGASRIGSFHKFVEDHIIDKTDETLLNNNNLERTHVDQFSSDIISDSFKETINEEIERINKTQLNETQENSNYKSIISQPTLISTSKSCNSFKSPITEFPETAGPSRVHSFNTSITEFEEILEPSRACDYYKVPSNKFTTQKIIMVKDISRKPKFSIPIKKSETKTGTVEKGATTTNKRKMSPDLEQRKTRRPRNVLPRATKKSKSPDFVVPPKRMSCKAIKEDFYKQDMMLLQNGEVQADEYWNRMRNRPAISNLQEVEYLLRIDNQNRVKFYQEPDRPQRKSKFMPPLKHRPENSYVFESFRKSLKGNSTLSSSDTRVFHFDDRPEINIPSRSANVSANNVTPETKFKLNATTGITPAGYSKNKEEIDNIVKKYL